MLNESSDMKSLGQIFSSPYLCNGRAIGMVVVIVCPSVCNRCTLGGL